MKQNVSFQFCKQRTFGSTVPCSTDKNYARKIRRNLSDVTDTNRKNEADKDSEMCPKYTRPAGPSSIA